MRLSDNTLIISSLIISVIGIVLLLLTQVTNHSSFSEVYVADDTTTVTINGTIIDAQIHGNTTFVVVQQSCTLPLVLFTPKEFVVGQSITATGVVETYKGKKEIIIQ